MISSEWLKIEENPSKPKIAKGSAIVNVNQTDKNRKEDFFELLQQL